MPAKCNPAKWVLSAAANLIMQAAAATGKPADQCPAMCRPISVRSAWLARAS
jgi:hypothetical protein